MSHGLSCGFDPDKGSRQKLVKFNLMNFNLTKRSKFMALNRGLSGGFRGFSPNINQERASVSSKRST